MHILLPHSLSPNFFFFASPHRFLAEVEMGSIEPVVGGEAAEFVGRDQDPEKMGHKYI